MRGGRFKIRSTSNHINRTVLELREHGIKSLFFNYLENRKTF
jgi:hypothetical protein